MSDIQTQGGFAGDPASALNVVDTGGCCGSPSPAASTTPAESGVAVTSCCGTPVGAQAAGSCCGTPAEAGTVASGAGGCCG